MEEIQTYNRKFKTTNLTLLFSGYLIFTIALYIFGPYEWNTHNPFVTYTLLFLYVFAFWFGGKMGVQKSLSKTKINTGEVFTSKYYSILLKFFWPAAIITIVLSFVSLYRVINLYGLSGITDLLTTMGEDYKSLYFATETANSGADMYGGTLFSVASVVFSPITQVFIPFTIVAFKDLTIPQKIIGIVAIVIRTLSSISKGSNYSIFIIIIPVFVAWIILSKRKQRKKRSPKVTLVIVLGTVAVLYLFYLVMDNRMRGNLSFIQIGENSVDENHPFLNSLPSGLTKLVMWFEFYICQGYYGFSLATDVAWQPMFGSGFSRWLCLELDNIMPIPIYDKTYVYRIGEVFNWDDSANWHTAFSWFANDVSLFGVIIIMFFIGYILQRSFDVSVESLNPFSIGLLCLMIEMVTFLPCNNLIFSDSKTFISFFVYLIGYYFTKNINFKKVVTL